MTAKQKSKIIKRLKNERKTKKLIKFECYNTPENVLKIKKFIKTLSA